jgi:hypothetical protein
MIGYTFVVLVASLLSDTPRTMFAINAVIFWKRWMMISVSGQSLLYLGVWFLIMTRVVRFRWKPSTSEPDQPPWSAILVFLGLIVSVLLVPVSFFFLWGGSILWAGQLWVIPEDFRYYTVAAMTISLSMATMDAAVAIRAIDPNDSLDFANTLLLVDIPTIIGILILTVYTAWIDLEIGIRYTLTSTNFLAGAVGFQFILGNLIYGFQRSPLPPKLRRRIGLKVNVERF